jgi:lysyl-tRNA synthetase class 2
MNFSIKIKDENYKKIDAVERAGIDPFPMRCRRTGWITGLGDGEAAIIAGRVIHCDVDGGEITDESGTIRFCGGRASPVFSYLTTGDIVEIEGRREGDRFTVHNLRLLTKAVSPPSNEWVRLSGLKRRLIDRTRIITLIRRFFEEEGFVEVETPLLVRSPGLEPHLIAFETVYQDEQRHEHLYLPTSPEYAMKRLLSGGLERIFQVARAFRNEEISDHHNPEFTILEWYRAYGSYEEVMDDCERMIRSIVQTYVGSARLVYGGREIDVAPPWERVTVREVFRRYVGIDTREVTDVEAFRQVARRAGFDEVRDDDPWDVVFFKVFLDAVEPLLGREKPTFLIDYPASMAALAKQKTDDPTVAERFEVYIGGIELANGFTELNDPREQYRRFLAEQDEKRKMGVPVYPIDEAFMAAMEEGIPPAGGVALGVDRLVMLMTGARRIDEVIAFPFQVT